MIDSEIIKLLTTIPTAVFSLPLLLLTFYWFVAVLFGGDHDFGIDVDADTGGVFVTLGLSKVPLLVGVTILSFTGTAISMCFQHYVLSPIFSIYSETFNPYSLIFMGISVATVFGVFIVSALITGRIAIYISPAFSQNNGELKFEYIGKIAEVRTLTLNKDFGEIILNDGITDHIKYGHVDEDIVLNKGDKVLIISHDKERKSYLVEKE